MLGFKPKRAKHWTKLVAADHPVLRQVAKPVDMLGASTISPSELRLLVNDMFWLMQQHQGVGLAAPQVGLSLSVIVMNCGERCAMIDPEIVSSYGAVNTPDGCLTFPEKWVLIPRASIVKVSFYDLNGCKRERVFEGFEACCVQHEVDHLAGVLITDYEEFDGVHGLRKQVG